MKRIVLSVCAAVAAVVSAQGGTLYWKGPGNASTAANWCSDETLTTAAGAKPTTGDAIVFVAASGSMTWDIDDVELASWTQREGYAGTVTFKTGKKNGTTTAIKGWTDDGGETRILKISGDCVLLGGTWTGTAQPSLASGLAKTSGEGVYRLIAHVGGNLAVTNTTFSVDGQGFPNGQGPVSFDDHGGGIHAGIGGRFGQHNKTFNQGPCYGTFRAPVTIGSGGGGSGGEDRKGGGAIQLVVAGAFLPGETAKFSAIAPEKAYYVGAGGSIFITAGSMVGGGSYSARGGVSTQGYGGGGGGGRIAFHVTDAGADFSRFTGTYTTHAQGQSPAGFGGTTYFETVADGAGGGILVVDGLTANVSSVWKYGTAVTAEDCAYEPRKLVLRDAAALGVMAGGVFKVKEVEVRDYLLTNARSQLRTLGGSFAFPADFTVPSNLTVHCWNPGTLTVGDGTSTLTLAPGAGFKCDAASTLQGSLVISKGVTVSHSQEWEIEKGVATLPRGQFDLKVTGDVTVEADAEISARGLGYGANSGPGANNGPGMHGGLVRNAGASKHCYGSITRPTSFGSGGGSNGGGAIALTVLGNLLNNGTITADGGNSSSSSGAGGSVWVRARTLSGGGAFSANGGIVTSGLQYGTPGSGGRVAVWLTGEGADFEDFDTAGGRFEAFGGTVKGSTIAASSGGGAGTVYKQTGAQQEHEGTLIIDNGGANTYLTEICAGGIGAQDVTDTEVGDVIIRNGGMLKVDTATLTVHGAWSNLTANAAAVGGTVAFVDASRPSLIGGTSEFSSLECVAPGKSIVFPPAAEGVTSVSAGGVLKLVGDAEHPVSLASLAEETEWFFTVGAGASCELRYLDVNRSNATNGILLVARDSAASAEKNNLNWEFPNIVPGATNEWTAAEDRDWVNIANWSQGRLPVETDCVLVPGGVGAANGPVLSGLPVAVSNLIVESGASLDLGGVDLTVGGFTRVAGALTARGTETLRLCGDVDLTGATVASARSTVVLPGDGTWRVKTGGAVFWDVTAERSGGSLAFPDGLTATHNLRLVATDAWMADFAATTVTCARANFIGTAGNVAALTLTGTDWALDAKGDVGATGVLVDHCTAKRSAVYADAASVDNGNNVNWVFGAAACRWTGGSGNWSSASWSGGTPSVTSHVVIDTAVTVTVDVPAAAGTLVVRGGGKLQVNKSLIVADALEVDDGSTVTVNTADPVVVTNNFVVRTGGKVTTASQKSLTLSVEGDALVEKDGLITALGLGYASSGESVTYAGTHAGRQLRTRASFHAYGSIRRPITFGRGGSWTSDGGSAGGGAVRLTVAGELRVDGTVTADGYGGNYGSGAGGSVWITAGSLVGSGTISADGGTCPQSNGNHQPGSGGRVAVWLTDPESVFGDFEDRIHAWGGRVNGGTVAGSYGSGAGTVYLKTGAQADNGGTLVIASDGSGNCAYDTEIAAGGLDGMTTDVTDTDVGTVIVKGGARLLITNATVTVSGDWGPHERAPNVGGTVAFADASRTSHVYGSTTFREFSCTEPGKRIEFDTSEDAVTRIREAGVLTIVGAEGYSVVLRPMTEDVTWRIAVGDRSVPTLAHVDVALSDAREGMLLVATDSTVSEPQGNQNWSFPAPVNPGEEITWTGEAGTSWADAKNWDLERIPCETDCVFVPNTANQPVLNGVMPTLNELTIELGASLNLNDNNLTVTNVLRVAGELVCTGTETIRVDHNADFTGGKLTAARSTLLLAGDGDQTVTRGTASLWNVTAAKGSGTVTFADDLKVDNFVAFSATSAWTALFANGSTCSCRRFDANGFVNDAAALTLTGGSWSLSVSAYVGVKGVRVANSRATRCEAYASDSVDLGGNEGWHFEAPVMWTGASGNFSDKTKWSTGEVPCETNHVVIPAGKTVTVDVAADVKSMDVFGTVSATSPFSVRESLSVLDGGTLTHPANGSTETYKLDVTVGGDLYVADTAKITTLGKGYANSTGPSGAAGYTGPGGYCAPSHGGRGDTYQGSAGATRCYGSIFRPTHIGAGGWSAGGGAVILKVGGTVQVDGSVDAQGAEATHYSGAGGSVYIKCGALVGGGTISANCGNITDAAQHYGGGGGRVAVWQTTARDWSAWVGHMSAYGSRYAANNALYGSAGTVYRQHAGQAEFCGEVIVDNAGGGWTYGTDLPPPVFSDDSKRALRHARIFLRNHAKLCIAADVEVNDVTMEATGSQLNLEGHTLSIMSDAHRKRKGWQGSVTEAGGKVIWPRGLMLIIR